VIAYDVDLIINVRNTVDIPENVSQQVLEVKRRNTPAYGEYATAAFKSKAIATTTKVDVSFQ
jgi:hypothetical protein